MKKVLTIILDGFGLRDEVKGNAIKMAGMHNFDALFKKYPHSSLEASGPAIGLPKGQFGNSEIGHMTIGAGRIVKQERAYIDEFFKKKQYEKNETFLEMVQYLKETNKAIHIAGLISDGGVHAHINHLKHLLNALVSFHVTNIYIDFITDGRDTSPESASTYINDIQDFLTKLKVGEITSICGRYYAMDRDKHFDRTQKYYNLIANGVGLQTNNVLRALKECYAQKITDEFIVPISLNKQKHIEDGDVFFWLNYRNDRSKQIVSAFSESDFDEFLTTRKCPVYTFFPIDKLNVHHFMEENIVENPLGRYLGELGLTQARIAETEKYPHVTYFFDGGYNKSIPGCDKFQIPSPKVATYDLKPEMSAVEITKKAIACMEKDYDFIFINYANPDMVGHTGNLEATIKAVLTVDICVNKLVSVAEDNFYTCFILGDHGNADIMLDEKNNPVTTHTMNPVPFLVTDKKVKLKDGNLSQVAPTILRYMDIALPKEMKETEDLLEEE